MRLSRKPLLHPSQRQRHTLLGPLLPSTRTPDKLMITLVSEASPTLSNRNADSAVTQWQHVFHYDSRLLALTLVIDFDGRACTSTVADRWRRRTMQR
jgi:hypothetical protein